MTGSRSNRNFMGGRWERKVAPMRGAGILMN